MNRDFEGRPKLSGLPCGGGPLEQKNLYLGERDMTFKIFLQLFNI